MTPNVVGIGAQKCASSWVHSVLGAHPEIGVSDPKELDFFSYYFDRGYHWYDAHFADLSQLPVRCETSPSYFYDPRSAERVWTYASDMKIIAVLRDPVARAYSNHLHEVIKGHSPCRTFEEGMLENPTYVDQGRYHTHLKRWFDVFGPDQLLVLIAEEISADPAGAAGRLYDFVGAERDFVSAVAFETRNVSDRARSPGLRRALRNGGDLMRRAGLEEHLARIKSVAPVSHVLKMNSVDIRAEVPPMAETARRRLTEMFAPEVTALAGLLGRDAFPWPTWEAVADRSVRTSVSV
jgi:hypothetical protein